MKTKKFFLLYFFWIIAFYSHSFLLYAQSDTTKLKEFLKNDLSKEVNKVVSPIEKPCADQSIESQSTRKKAEDRKLLLENYLKLDGDPIALSQALCFFDKHKLDNFEAVGDPSRRKGIKIQNQRYITINDLNKSSKQTRMYILDLETGKVRSLFSAHGVGGLKGVAESGEYAEEFSNKEGSYATPRGFFITGSRINTSSYPTMWKFSMKLHGLQEDINDNSFVRAVIMHPFPPMPNEIASSDDEKPGTKKSYNYALSWGCTMIGPAIASGVIDQLKASNSNSGGSLYYNYTDIEKAKGEKYCGQEKLLIKK